MLLKEYPVMDDTQSVADYAQTVAHAQLKQVVECGEELCYDHNGEQREEQGWFVKRHDCPQCWQDLKKEASLDT